METSARYGIIGFFVAASIVAGFLFVYWLHNSGGAGQTMYWIRFEQPVIGVRPGVSVLFNGLRVGDVRQVGLSAANPKEVRALVAIDPATPVRADTAITIDSQGLMGSAVVSLVGGAPSAEIPRGADGAPPELAASALAGQTITQAAKATLKRLDDILGENSEALHSTIGNIKIFSDALARNSDKVDDVLNGLAKMAGGGTTKPLRTFELATPKVAAGKVVNAQVAVPDLTSILVFETQRMLVAPHPGEKAQIEGGQWNDTLPKIVQERMIQTLEAAGFTHVSRNFDGFASDYQLVLDIRGFEISLDPSPQANVEINAKLIGKGGRILASRVFGETAPAKGADAPDAAEALGVAFGKAANELASWTRDKIAPDGRASQAPM